MRNLLMTEVLDIMLSNHMEKHIQQLWQAVHDIIKEHLGHVLTAWERINMDITAVDSKVWKSFRDAVKAVNLEDITKMAPIT